MVLIDIIHETGREVYKTAEYIVGVAINATHRAVDWLSSKFLFLNIGKGTATAEQASKELDIKVLNSNKDSTQDNVSTKYPDSEDNEYEGDSEDRDSEGDDISTTSSIKSEEYNNTPAVETNIPSSVKAAEIALIQATMTEIKSMSPAERTDFENFAIEYERQNLGNDSGYEENSNENPVNVASIDTEFSWDGEFNDQQDSDSPLSLNVLPNSSTEEPALYVDYYYPEKVTDADVDNLIKELCNSFAGAATPSYNQEAPSSSLAGRCGTPAIQWDDCDNAWTGTVC